MCEVEYKLSKKRDEKGVFNYVQYGKMPLKGKAEFVFFHDREKSCRCLLSAHVLKLPWLHL
jgi:hypothetical protein